jgi:hypothetical protein
MWSRIAGSFWPLVPHIPSRLSFPRVSRSRHTSAATPQDLSEFEALPQTNPVVYSPVPIIKQPGGPREASVFCFFAGLAAIAAGGYETGRNAALKASFVFCPRNVPSSRSQPAAYRGDTPEFI